MSLLYELPIFTHLSSILSFDSLACNSIVIIGSITTQGVSTVVMESDSGVL